MIRIRAARAYEPARVQAIEDVAGKTFADVGMAAIAADPPPAIAELLHRQLQGRVVVAVDDLDRPVTSLTFDLVDRCVYVEEVAVDPAYARQGIGGALLDHAGRLAGGHGLGALTLTAFIDVPWNAPYYERLGFRRLAPDELTSGLGGIRRHEAKRGLDRWPRVCMRRELA